MGKTIAQLSAILFTALFLATGVGHTLPRGEQILYLSSSNWLAITWYVYRMDMERDLSQPFLVSRTDTMPGVPVGWSPDGTQIAYLSDKALQTYLVSTDGGHPERLGDGLTNQEYNPEWSPDGNWLAFIGQQNDQWDVYLAAPDGGNPHRMTFGHQGFNSLSWSQDSCCLALESALGDIYILDMTTGRLRNLTDSSSSDIRPAWSPDGKQIAFMSSRNANAFGTTRFDLYLIDADGSNLRRYTNTFPADNGWQIYWSPDGTHIAFGSISWSGGSDIYLVDVPTRLVRNVTRDAARDSSPAWSPDSRYIAFESRQNSRWVIDIMSADGWQRQRITANATDSRRPIWSPDGTRILYVSDVGNNWDLYMTQVGAKVTQRVTSSRSIETAPIWRP